MENVAVEISIVIPTRNRGADLGRCLTALSAQSYPFDRTDWGDRVEIIICDDGSDESLDAPFGTAAELGLPVRWVRQEPAGPAAARNSGIRAARGGIIALTDSDTLPDPEWLEKLVETFNRHPSAVGVEGQVISNNEGQFDPLGEGPHNRNGGVYLTCNCAYRREALVTAGGFDETFPFPAYEDTELAARITRLGPIIWQPGAVVVHPQRPVTILTVLGKLRHWEYVLIMGFRYGYLGWERYPVRHPRLRVALLAVIALPLSKLTKAFTWAWRRPVAAAKLAGLGLIEALGALIIVVPRVLFGDYRNRVIRRQYL